MANYDPPGGLSLLPVFKTPATTTAPAVAPAPAAAGGFQIPAGLATFPGLLEQITRLNTSGGTNQSLLTALRKRLLIQFGKIPDNLNSVLTGNANADIDQATKDLAYDATKGGVSTVAGLQRDYDLRRNLGIAQLAAHGLARSGGTGQVINETLGNYQRSLYGAEQTLQDQLGQGYQTFLGQQDTLGNQFSQAVKDALAGQAAGVANGTIAASGATGAGASGAPAAKAVPDTPEQIAARAAQGWIPAPGAPAGTGYVRRPGTPGGGPLHPPTAAPKPVAPSPFWHDNGTFGPAVAKPKPVAAPSLTGARQARY